VAQGWHFGLARWRSLVLRSALLSALVFGLQRGRHQCTLGAAFGRCLGVSKRRVPRAPVRPRRRASQQSVHSRRSAPLFTRRSTRAEWPNSPQCVWHGQRRLSRPVSAGSEVGALTQIITIELGEYVSPDVANGILFLSDRISRIEFLIGAMRAVRQT
jgi:hypothetical protein